MRGQATVALLLLSTAAVFGEPDPAERLDRFKAIFLYNFIQFVNWPEADSARVFTISLLGPTSIEGPLLEIAEKRTVAGRKLEVNRLRNLGELGFAHVLFVPTQQSDSAAVALRRIAGTNILAIGDAPGMGQRGMAINFVVIDDNLKFEINQNALERAGLGASSQLLKLAIHVADSEAPGR